MANVRLPTTDLENWARGAIYSRIPLDVADPRAMQKAAALAKEFVTTHPWAKAQGDELDLDELIGVVVPWARSKGYDLNDEPPSCPYIPAPKKWIRCWGPPEKSCQSHPDRLQPQQPEHSSQSEKHNGNANE